MTSSVAGATLSVTQTVTLWTVFLPELTDIKRHTPGRNPEFADDVRYAAMSATVVSGAIAVMICKIERSWEPLTAWAVVSGMLFIAYECTLRTSGTLASVSVIHNTETGVN